jgi:hypothetical protein
MRIIHATIPSNCDFVLHGDSHEGNAARSDKALGETIEFIGSNSIARFVHMGDALEAIMVNDKRYNVSVKQQESRPVRQARTVVDQYKPIRKKGLAWVEGNHEDILVNYGSLVDDIICHDLGIPFAGSVAKLHLHDKHGLICKVWLQHGFRGNLTSNAKDFEQRRANMMASLKIRLLHKACDCLVMACGHTHKLFVVDPAQRLIMRDDGTDLTQAYLGPGDGAADYIEPDRRWYVNTGSYLCTHIIGGDTYAERAGYDPVEIGHAVMEIRDRKVVAVRRVVQ